MRIKMQSFSFNIIYNEILNFFIIQISTVDY